ncbi:MAG TPA: transglutaminase-like domain-containing protein [Candidatus Acidoferrum sp.]|nr:transglutaminase-like domain-containing protein [Candidatus Acidoferrum sp.]
MKTSYRLFAAALIFSFALSGCSQAVPVSGTPAEEPAKTYGQESETMTLTETEVPLEGAPVSTLLVPAASGTVVHQGGGAVIDASNTADGYVMIKYTLGGTPKLKVLVTGPSGVQYTYNLSVSGNYETFPLSDGNGSYKVGVYKNVTGTKYSALLSRQMTVALADEFAPFLRPNQYVNYTQDSKTLAKAKELTEGKTELLDKVDAVYTYIINNFSYDKEKAKTVQSGYLPDLDAVLEAGKGICFDYSAVMTAMLRSQGIPTKLVVGYAGKAYHSWINVYSKDTGWVEGIIYFDGSTWKLMDPTFASSGKSSEAIMDYIGNGSNYTAKYLY